MADDRNFLEKYKERILNEAVFITEDLETT